jgi:hypothetical protein
VTSNVTRSARATSVRETVVLPSLATLPLEGKTASKLSGDRLHESPGAPVFARILNPRVVEVPSARGHAFATSRSTSSMQSPPGRDAGLLIATAHPPADETGVPQAAGAGVGVGEGLGDGVGLGLGLGLGEGEGLGLGEGDGVGEGLGEGLGKGVGVGEGTGEPELVITAT